MLSPGRIVKADQGTPAGRELRSGGSHDDTTLPRARVARRELFESSQRAVEIERAASERAEQVLAAARADARQIAETAAAQARAEATLEFGARMLRLAALEAQLDQRHLERTITLAQVLAERLLGEALRLDRSHVVALARQALSEARGARRITVHAHPSDASELERNLAALGVDAGSVRVALDHDLAEGNLRIDTELGQLHAALGPQLAVLATKLRESLVHGQ